jgi:hypothetical protein
MEGKDSHISILMGVPIYSTVWTLRDGKDDVDSVFKTAVVPFCVCLIRLCVPYLAFVSNLRKG